ncbi:MULTISPECIES: FHA domain-containing protein FhaB/FipA [Tessaracoccus]|uniref:FHA domain-containing protein n=2 Tax=Tessaracoccus TaxID=72763 RepID=A0ABY8PYF9_9ACTN|nr:MULTISPECIES: FHA domain-containing protein [Tessaracoccus]QXT62584.1 FHA domain-containing protein [Tessaracoccus palaemonis]WGT47526.1 FHA domain-containing protein [Tessaracoccus sp. T21]
MSDLIIAAIKVVFLVLLWMFILFVANVVRTDLYGRRVPVASLSAIPADRGRGKGRSKVPTRFAITAGPQQGVSVPVEPTINLGRAADSTLLLDDDYASARHAQLVQQDADSWLITDLRSTNGTYVNGKLVTEPTRVTVGDVVRIGKTLMRLEI